MRTTGTFEHNPMLLMLPHHGGHALHYITPATWSHNNTLTTTH